MKTFPELRSSVADVIGRNLVTEDAGRAGDVLQSDVDGWIIDEAVSLMQRADTNPQLLAAFAPLITVGHATISTGNHVDYPTDFVRSTGRFDVEGREGRVVASPTPVGESARSSMSCPFAVETETGLDVQPHMFGSKRCSLEYYRKPTADNLFGDEIADALIYGAARRALLVSGESSRLNEVNAFYGVALSVLKVSRES